MRPLSIGPSPRAAHAASPRRFAPDPSEITHSSRAPPDTKDHAMIRRFLLGVLVPAIAAAAVVAPAASAMPMRDGYSAAGMHANKVHHRVRPAALVDAA